MQKIVSLKLLPEEANDETRLKEIIASTSGLSPEDVTGWVITKQSIDARSKTVWINISLTAFVNEPFQKRVLQQFSFKEVSEKSKKVVIVGGGPAGLFAALFLLEQGIKPIILERGKDVRARRRDLADLNKHGIVNHESNYCFGEGGAGTYSDGKLYTRSNKRGDIERILNLFVYFGADEKILYQAHPHIGTNKLPQIITSMRETILARNGEFLFNKKVVDLKLDSGKIESILTSDGESYSGDGYILATGHSAGDIYELLHRKNIAIVSKPFALGVRIEHPQSIIDDLQYYGGSRNILPPASYSLVQQVDGKGVFSFCMCPGGIIAPASSSNGELVVNGWSPSKRNNPFANSGIVVQVEQKDAFNYLKKKGETKDVNDPLLLFHFQKKIEALAYYAGGGGFVAPAQRMVDFVNKKESADLPKNSYLPGLRSVELRTVLPPFISSRLAEAFTMFDKKMPARSNGKGYFTNEAVIVGVESRTSSSIKIPRLDFELCHPEVSNFYPCGEGAGYAGGIVSAAMDGERIAAKISTLIS